MMNEITPNENLQYISGKIASNKPMNSYTNYSISLGAIFKAISP